MAIRRPASANVHYPAGSGRFPRDISGSTRASRNERSTRAPPGSPRIFGRGRGNDDDDDDIDGGGADKAALLKGTLAGRLLEAEAAAADAAFNAIVDATADPAVAGDSARREPYLPNLESFIGNYRKLPQSKPKPLTPRPQPTAQQLMLQDENCEPVETEKRGADETRRSAEHMQLHDEDSS